MFTLTISLDAAGLASIKSDLRQALPSVKSSHRCEALARGLGWRTYAALLAAISSDEALAMTVHGARFRDYLAEHGFVVSPRPLYLATGRVAVRAVLNREPKLNSEGYGFHLTYHRRPDGTLPSRDERATILRNRREELLEDPVVEEFLHSLALIQTVSSTKTIRPSVGSYRLKHIAEQYRCSYPEGEQLGSAGYVCNGALIVAAVHAGFRYESYRDSVNVAFNMSKSAVDGLAEQVRGHGRALV